MEVTEVMEVPGDVEGSLQTLGNRVHHVTHTHPGGSGADVHVLLTFILH